MLRESSFWEEELSFLERESVLMRWMLRNAKEAVRGFGAFSGYGPRMPVGIKPADEHRDLQRFVEILQRFFNNHAFSRVVFTESHPAIHSLLSDKTGLALAARRVCMETVRKAMKADAATVARNIQGEREMRKAKS